ncbi:MAG: acetyl-CoA carboxylase carboxyltransferase subunit alpha [Acidobacteria bacterium]|nr:acetyl-CoA carboxylase carboxyltransferase subunit alpha [Acidobacteriota bacterium]MBK8150671.1 acetyl-CoA carboxylase carboxyltransferase subunit alpha [Acidobacteriota bacterium]MBK8811492.1 acetyl-CoA carboxylase carboxyltransferase subunit alpha [Acidobacteriota bacterium]
MDTLGEREEGAYARVQEARNPKRPYTLDLIETMFTDFVELHGDRRFADDPAMVCGFARLGDFDVAVVGQQKGRDMNQRRFRNFGMPKPEGYRKALRMMKLAEKFGRPVITFVDTPGAYPGIDAEERGQAEAIAFNLREMAALRVPLIVVVLGEGGSGGALAIGVGDRILMLENAVYSVITPEGCAAILWKDAAKASEAAAGLRLTADNLRRLEIIDGVVQEDFGDGSWEMSEEGAASDDRIFGNLKSVLIKNLRELTRLSAKELVKQRYDKFRKMGRWVE